MKKIRKYSLITKILLPIIILAIFLMPISPSLEKENINLAVNKVEAIKIAEAEDLPAIKWEPSIIKYDSGTSITTITKTLISQNNINFDKSRALFFVVYKLEGGQSQPNPDAITPIRSVEGPYQIPTNGSMTVSSTQNFSLPIDYDYYVLFIITDGNYDPYTQTFEKNVDHYVNNDWSMQGISEPFSLSSTEIQDGDITTDQTAQYTEPELDLDCGLRNIGGCIAQIVYLFFRIAAVIGNLAGRFLDFFIYYSTDSTSYKSDFVTKGWGAIRDVANIFFIIALLYIAIKTILNLNVSNNKKLISYIVIIALLINFSLFFTQVIIDGSNILAKIFYNNIESKDKNGDAVGATGEKSISVGLISLFNPQKLVTQKVYDSSGGVALFIFITILATFIVLYAAWIFFSVAILFVSRVVSLWISMIFSPIAFASYTLPFDIPGFGHKEWWSELLKNAFLAPIFIFFLYIIVMFAGFLKEIVEFPEGADPMQKVMAVVIPFAILMVMLMKAKQLAVTYAGKMGEAVSKAGAMVGGLALGVATGGAALALRKTAGYGMNKMANSAWVSKMASSDKKLLGMHVQGAIGNKLMDVSKAGSKGSFDVRGVKIGGKGLADTGLKVGKAGGVGGYEKARADKIEKRQKRAKELEAGPDEELTRKVRKAEIDLDDAKSDPIRNEQIATKTKEITDSEKELEAANREVAAAERAVADAERAVKDAIDQFGATSIQANTARATRDATINNPGGRNDKILQRDTKQAEVLTKKTDLKALEADIKLAEKELVKVQNLRTAENKKRQRNYAENIRSGKFFNFFTPGRQGGAEEAADKIRARSASENKQQTVAH